MNNILISTIRFGVIASVALFAFAGQVFAAPVLTAVVAQVESSTSATLFAKDIDAEWRNTTVWFEFGETQDPTEVIGLREIFAPSSGNFSARLTNLKPNTRYYFRAVAVAGIDHVSSPVKSFTTKVSAVSTQSTQTASTNTASTNINNSTQTSQSASVANASNTGSTQKTNKVATTATKKVTATPEVNKNCEDAKTVTATTVVKGTNSNSASVAGAGISVFPSTLIGWIALIIALLFVVLIVRIIHETNEKRRKAHEEAEALRRVREIQKEL